MFCAMIDRWVDRWKGPTIDGVDFFRRSIGRTDGQTEETGGDKRQDRVFLSLFVCFFSLGGRTDRDGRIEGA